jgi:hypothetical protein
VKKRDALIDVIVGNLKASPRSRHDVDLIVRAVIDDLNGVLKNALAGEPSLGVQAVNKRYGREVEALTRSLLKKLYALPEGTLRALMSLSAYSGQSIPKWPENWDWEMIKRYSEVMRSHLVALQAGATTIRSEKIGYYHNVGYTKRFCAGAAFDLMTGLEAGTPTQGDPLLLIANTLFEIVTGKERDLRGQCEDVLAHWRDNPDRLRENAERLRHDFTRMIAE